jgi:hypothetical protein
MSDDDDGGVVIHQCIKFFWRMKCTVDFTIVEHVAADTIEVICYERTTCQYASRLYLSRTSIVAKLDTEVMQEKLRLLRETALRRRDVFAEKKCFTMVLREVMSDYITGRLVVSDFSVLQLVVKFQESADSSAEDGAVFAKPANLRPAPNPVAVQALK